MPVAGLVLRLNENDPRATAALNTIRANRKFTCGTPPEPGCVPVVMESEDDAESRRQLSWLQQLPGVLEVNIVSVDCSDLAPPVSCESEHSYTDDDTGASPP